MFWMGKVTGAAPGFEMTEGGPTGGFGGNVAGGGAPPQRGSPGGRRLTPAKPFRQATETWLITGELSAWLNTL
jgi:hypothetical protein